MKLEKNEGKEKKTRRRKNLEKGRSGNGDESKEQKTRENSF